MKNKKIVIAIALILPVAVLLSLCLVPWAVNNARAHRLERELHLLDYGSSDIEVIDSQSVCGKLNGNGNGMQYFAAILLKTDGITAEEIETHLTSVRDEYDILGVQVQSTPELDCRYPEHASLTFDVALQDDASYVAVYIMETGNDFWALLDIRGH